MPEHAWALFARLSVTRGYGATDAHYDSVGAALLQTLEQGLGSAWTAGVKSAWAAAYALLAEIMDDAANDRTAPTQRAVA